MIELFIAGVPAPQGSKTRTKWGMREDNPNTKPWRAAVAAEAVIAMRGKELLSGPLKLEAVFSFPRPQSHYGTGKNAGVLKASAPLWKTGKPDYDKLLRAAGDALTGTAIRDDAMIVTGSWRKMYGNPAGARLILTEI